MKSTRAVLFVFPAVVIVLCLMAQPALAQNATAGPATTQQQPTQPSDNPTSAPEGKTFSGKIVKDGNKFVLADLDSRTTFQLDDQEKAKEYVNKSVKVTGVLDPSTGTIRVTMIEPAS